MRPAKNLDSSASSNPDGARIRPPCAALRGRSFTSLLTALCVVLPLAIFSHSTEARSFTATDLLPLEVDNSWTYLVDGVEEVRTVVDSESVSGETFFTIEVLSGPDAGAIQIGSNNENGLRTHRVFVPGFDGGEEIYAPPLLALEEEFDAGSDFAESGSLTLTLTGTGTFPATYQNEVTVTDLESVSVPAGTFDALRVDTVLVIDVDVSGTSVEISSSGSEWFVSGIGVVKASGEVDGEPFLTELVATNVPEPSAWMLQTAALLSVAFAGRWRSAHR